MTGGIRRTQETTISRKEHLWLNNMDIFCLFVSQPYSFFATCLFIFWDLNPKCQNPSGIFLGRGRGIQSQKCLDCPNWPSQTVDHKSESDSCSITQNNTLWHPSGDSTSKAMANPENSYKIMSYHIHDTVDGRNPAPPWMVQTL